MSLIPSDEHEVRKQLATLIDKAFWFNEDLKAAYRLLEKLLPYVDDQLDYDYIVKMIQWHKESYISDRINIAIYLDAIQDEEE